MPIALVLWKYDAGDLFDDQLLAADPSLATFQVFTTGLDLATAIGLGSFQIGAGTSVQFQHNLGLNRQRFAVRAGVIWEDPAFMTGVSWTGAPGTTPVSDLQSGTARGTVAVKPLRQPFAVQAGLDIAWSVNDHAALTTSAVVGPPPLRLILGWHWRDRQLAAGIDLTVEHLSLTVGREFGGRDTLGGLTVLTFSLRW